MILPAQHIRRRNILRPCLPRTSEGGLTYGLGPAGYDLRLDLGEEWTSRYGPTRTLRNGEFALAAACEHFVMPDDVTAVVHDKSSLARRGLSVFNTVIEPGWRGYLTLELVHHGEGWLELRQGQGIAQVVFHQMTEPTEQPYEGKYQDQGRGPQEARA